MHFEIDKNINCISQITNLSEATPESVWAILREVAASQAETNRIVAANALQTAENERILTEMFAETKELVAANALQTAENERMLTEMFAETKQLVAANALQTAENERMLTEMFAETKELVAANALKTAETERMLTEMFAETKQIVAANALKTAEIDRQIAANALKTAEIDRQMAETDRHISRLEKQIGGVTNSHGSFAEEYFYNSIERGDMIFFGEKFDKIIKFEIMKDENNIMTGELDLILVNGNAVIIFEVKFKVRKKHVEQIKKKVKPFREKFPEYKNHELFLGFASMVFDDEVQNACIENGIAVVKQLGDTIVIHDKNLKSF